ATVSVALGLGGLVLLLALLIRPLGLVLLSAVGLGDLADRFAVTGPGRRVVGGLGYAVPMALELVATGSRRGGGRRGHCRGGGRGLGGARRALGRRRGRALIDARRRRARVARCRGLVGGDGHGPGAVEGGGHGDAGGGHEDGGDARGGAGAKELVDHGES